MKNYAKEVLRLLFIIIVFPLVILYWLGSLLSTYNAFFPAFSQLLSIVPGKTGSYIRCAFYRFVMTRCDPDCIISFATIFSQQDTEIESGAYIGPQCNIGMCKIEKNCLIGSGVHILSGKRQHDFTDIDKPIRDQGGTFEKVVIGEDTWIGNGSLILANVGKKCVIAAGSVVVDDVNDHCVMAGNPAKVIKNRKD